MKQFISFPKSGMSPANPWRGILTCLLSVSLFLSCTAFTDAPAETTPYAGHGTLSVQGTDLVDRQGNVFQLKGVSTHGLAWYPQYVNKDAFLTLRDDWGMNLVRLALYTEEYGGYASGGNQEELEQVIDRGVQAATALGMYVILDWHVLMDQNPKKYEAQALAFFEKMSLKYASYGNVLYEICNEPNSGTSWEDIREYAEKVIPVIRKNAPESIVIVGTPTWSQDVDTAAGNPLSEKNVLYALHFYAATHGDFLRNKLSQAREAGLPIIISEFSICDASGNGAVDYASAEAWKSLIRQHQLSYAGWNLSNKNEASALLLSSTEKTNGGWQEQELSETGRWLRAMSLEAPHS